MRGLWFMGVSVAAALCCGSASAQPYDAQQQAVLAYYAKHYPAYYQRYYGGVQPVALPPAPPPAPGDRPAAGPDVAGLVEGEDADKGARTLSGHTFHYPRLIDGAFTATSFFVGSSVEWFHQGDVTRSVGEGGETVQYDRDLAYVRLRYGVDFAFAENFTIGLDADYLIEIGTNQASLILDGGQTGYDFRPNFKWRLWRSDDSGSQLALRGHGTISGGVRAVPEGLLDQLTEAQCETDAMDCALGDDAITRSMSATQSRRGGGGTLSFAQALGSYLGLQMAAGAEGANKTLSTPSLGDVGATSMLVHMGLAPSINLYPSLPIGMTAEYRYELDRTVYAGSEAAGVAKGAEVLLSNHRWAAGLYYTGRRDLMLGWIAGASLLQSPGDLVRAADGEEPDGVVVSGQFDMRYFF